MYQTLSQEERDFLSLINQYFIYDGEIKISQSTPNNIKDLWCIFRIKGVLEDCDGYVPPDMDNIKEMYCSINEISSEQYDAFYNSLTLEKIEHIFNKKLKIIKPDM